MMNHSWVIVGFLAFALFSPGVATDLLQKNRQLAPGIYSPREGDILFQSLPRNEVIDAIEGCTASPFSHCGIVVSRKHGWHVLEAVGPVKETLISRWIMQGRDWKFAAFRLKPEHQLHTLAMISAAREFKGLPYDIQYEMDDEKIYCSELIYKGFLKASGRRLGVTRNLGDLNWKPHERIIRAICGGEVPMKRVMITPRDLSEAEQLFTVLSFGKHGIASIRN